MTVLVISIAGRTSVVAISIDKHAHIEELDNNCRYVNKEKDPEDQSRSTPHRVNSQKHQDCN